MKIEEGKTKITGFKFENLTEGVAYLKCMDECIGKEGIIISMHHESFFKSVRVEFEDGISFAYPLEMSKNYIINNESKDKKIMKRKAIIICEEPQEESKGIEFTHFLNVKGEWDRVFYKKTSEMKEIKSFTDFNGNTIFICVSIENTKLIYKGNLNDGTY